ncbi:anthranilate synthase component I [uncultured Reyranella sp.]|uniref:anthranilate synthase component I n=1 Tax=uncultured Reyranella sp. TaxID=735512 RepID=UPI00259CDB7F|nr:anthranilate synthase component I [uncultured Reyranella sp.]
MSISPDFDAFAARYDSGTPQVVSTKLVADLETPVSAYLKLADGRPNSFLLESVEGGSVRGRYSIIGFKPDVVWRCRKGQAEINRRADKDSQAFDNLEGRPLETLRALIKECQMELPADLPPMASGLFGFLGYDMVRDMERLPDTNPDPIGLPDAIMVRPTLICIFDRLEDNVTLVTPVWPQKDISAHAAYEVAQERLADAVSDFERTLPFRRDSADDLDALPEPQANMSKEDFKAMVETCKEYIRAGDAFQIVPSQRFSLPFKLPPLSLYRALRRINPSPFLIFFDYGDFTIVGSSPEILVRLRDDTVTIRPLAGTIRRGVTPEEDKQLAEKLLADPKERAEHLMLVDLARNDVGRVSKIGSVRVVEQFTIEKYSHVQHISSHVEGKIEDGLDAIDVLKAGFPAGTLSGAPKVRAMQIIDEVEPVRRGMYAGCAGYFAANGTMDTCILLRTGLVKDGTMFVQAGVGVVADSDLEAEYQESVAKAKALVRAAEEAVRFASAGQWSAGNKRR